MRNILVILLLLAPLSALAGNLPVPIEDFSSFKLKAEENTKISAGFVLQHIAAAAQKNEFEIIDTTDSSITLRIEKTDFHMDVVATYDGTSIKINYKDSAGLGYRVESDGVAYINPNYNIRIRKLITSIGANPTLLIPGGTTLSNGLNIGISRNEFFTVHYYRKLKDWTANGGCSIDTCWGLHIWGGATIDPTTWDDPIFPKSFDDFGAIYYARQNKNSNSSDELHYILHMGEEKEQCGYSMNWDVKKSTTVFVVEGDCNIYYDLAKALTSPEYVKQ